LLFIEFDSKESQPIANPGANSGSVLTDAAREHQCVESAESRRECANPFLDLVAKQSHGFRRPHVLLFALQQVAHVGTRFRNAEQSGFEIDHLIETLGVHVPRLSQIPDQPGVDIAGASAHRDAGCRSEAHAGIHGFAVMHRGQARAIAEVGEDHPALRHFRSPQAVEFAHQIGIRQSVKSVPPHSLRFVTARDGQDLGNAWHVMVKSRIEARHLGQGREAAMKLLG
jgi:hypothetical protein